MNVKAKLQNLMDTQYSRPAGVLGWFIGEKMIRQHKPETLWTIGNLQLQENERILEIGCGAGFAMKQIASLNGGHNVTGLDVSETLLQSAAVRNKKAIRQNQMALVHGSVEEMPIPNEEFTFVFSIHSVYFWEDLSKSLKEIERVLSPGGTVLITLCDGKDGEDWGAIKKMIQSELLPIMEQFKFEDLRVLEGPVSRGYHTVAVCGVKSSTL
ncbi:class I SAM-dependent methyltransferase [Rossellomorea sp. KS-H15a]|uniref:class I SAM-dependent methyltransferase n=1 Tax=Rossellomorea sp. KS-H15a TaxID=2963940 RepID=UPI0020C625FF|nr:class I SAM-dependent methyltransferase [Rossellomorea sp. KS-H15a]UTE76674.1 class I SAM-dependent methyltransferase [Rossellomorea sp. KS-H15a]